MIDCIQINIMEKQEKSKSGRVRRKPKKFVDYESPGEIDNVAVDQRQQIRKAKKKVSYFRKCLLKVS